MSNTNSPLSAVDYFKSQGYILTDNSWFPNPAQVEEYAAYCIEQSKVMPEDVAKYIEDAIAKEYPFGNGKHGVARLRQAMRKGYSLATDKSDGGKLTNADKIN
jgi:hypothetical protein